MEEKIISFPEFCGKLKTELLKFMPEEYRNGNYAVVIDEKKDEYDQLATWLYIENQKKPLAEAPMIPLDGAYENMKKIRDTNKVFAILAGAYEKKYSKAVKKEYDKYNDKVSFDIHRLFVVRVPKEVAEKDAIQGIFVMKRGENTLEYHLLLSDTGSDYRSCKVTVEQLKECNISEDELYHEALKNTPELLPLTVKRVPGAMQYNLTEAILIAKIDGTDWNMYKDEIHACVPSGQDFFEVDITGNTKMLFAADSVLTMVETNELLKELQSCGQGFLSEKVALFESESKKLITDTDEIEAIVSRKEKSKKSIFNRM